MTREHDDRLRIDSELRRLADEIIQNKAASLREDIEFLPPEEIRRIFHELRVHQIELEMQNVQLRETQAALEASQARYFDLYDMAPVGYCTISKEGLILEVNLKLATMLGLTRMQLAGQPISPRFIHKEDRGDYYLLLNRLSETGAPQARELRMVQCDGTVFWAYLSTSLAEDEGGSFHCRIVLTDITKRKRAEDALRQSEKALYESEQRLRLCIEHAPAALAMFDRDMHYLIASPRWLQEYELGDRDLIGLTSGDIYNIPERWKESIRRGLAGEVLREEEDRYERPDGSVWWVRWEIRPWYTMSADIGGIVVFAENITARKQEEQLQSLNDELEQIVERRSRALEQAQMQYLHAVKLSAIGQLTASIAHEFNNPLQGLRTILKGLKRRAILEEEDKELLDLAISENERMKNLIKSLQEFNKPSVGQKMAMDIHAALDDLLLLYKSEFKRKKISTERKYAEGFPPITVIPDQLKQVFLNLLNNATDACSEKGGLIKIATCHDNQKVVIAIQDTGVGIEYEMINKIFEPFFTTKTKEKGMGLGLSISKDIIQRHQGEIRVESQPGKSSTFTILLPINCNVHAL